MTWMIVALTASVSAAPLTTSSFTAPVAAAALAASALAPSVAAATLTASTLAATLATSTIAATELAVKFFTHIDLARSPNRRKALRRFGDLAVNIHTSISLDLRTASGNWL